MNAFNAHWPDVRIEDVYLVTGDGLATLRSWERFRKARWYKRATGTLRHLPAIHALGEAYKDYCFRYGREPKWTKRLAKNMQGSLRHLWLTGEWFDPLWIIQYRRGLGFSFAVECDGFIHDVAEALNVFRLGEIRQLGFLHDPVVNDNTADIGLAENFHHTRLLHSSTVMATAALIAHQIRLPKSLTRHLLVAALTHDILTPAGGDSVKPIDPDGLDEDKHYPEAFRNNPRWEVVRKRYGLDETLLAKTVAGQGLLGQLLDVADKTTYVDHDVDAYLKWNNPRKFRQLVPPAGFVEIWQLWKKLGQKACRLWDSLELIEGRLVITNPSRLAGFLRLRALMFRHLYFNPRARYREQMLALLVIEPLYHEGRLTRGMLLQMTDYDLMRWIDRETNCDIKEHLSRSDRAPVIESFATEEAALARLRTLHAIEPTLLFMLETFPQPSKKAVRMLVRNARGDVLPFDEAYPEEAESILAIGRDPEPVKLYILNKWKAGRILPRDLWEKLYARQRVRFNLE
ncbi:MAG: hypothetical protein ACEQSB_03060 [Undibacterium sp.]